MPDMNEILDRIDELPSLPAAVLQVIAMLSNERADVGAIEQVARHDEALAMTILRYANSARYGRPGRMFNLKESIVRLGGKSLMRIVLQQKVATLFERGNASYGMGRGALWRSALGGAIATERLTKRAALPEADLCFLCTLLRDIGKLALDAHFGRDYIRQVAEHMLPSKSFVQAERDALGFDHAQLGRELALRWELPERIAGAIGFHHEPPPPGTSHDPLFDMVHAADVMAIWAGLSVGVDGGQYHLAPHVVGALALDRLQADEDIAHIWSHLHEIESMMGGPMVDERRRA